MTFNQLGCPSWPVPPLLFIETRVRVQAGGILPPSSQRETDSARDGVFTARQHWDVASLWSGITPAAGRSLGDPENKAASNADYLLSKLLSDHPNMKVNFLSQVRLSHYGDGAKVAKRLVEVYFALFKLLIS
ncbi:hypothetical protein HanXRQr2_Chr04g0184581 [Helianthus annuus]|uniref:Uncharacterized protein n=1 Tax=Helianthus annuus TaxID=4232 RepID=A0A9K3JBC2_HELAN|nr:hypothetical protein HanXRQr2_Chr04g0184581 [Helianthus annuus]